MFRVLRDLLKYDGRFRFAFILLAVIVGMILLSLVSPYDPNKTFVVAMDMPPSLEHLFRHQFPGPGHLLVADLRGAQFADHGGDYCGYISRDRHHSWSHRRVSGRMARQGADVGQRQLS